MPSKNKAGWNWLTNATKWHWFDTEGRSLCKRWMTLGSNDDAQTDPKFGSPDNCKTCETKLKKLLQEEQSCVVTQDDAVSEHAGALVTQ